jgi:acyl-CoA synthetase (AMP-forming)/AMP-acid ligase II
MPPDTMDRLVRLRGEQHGDKPMVIDTESRISYGELDATTRALATAFVEAGVGKGTRVGLIMPNRVQWVQIAVALTRVGAVLVPLSTVLQPPELVAQLRAASVQVLIAVEEFRGHRYLDDLAEVVGSPKLPALRDVWTPERLVDRRGGPMIDALAAAVTPSDTLVIMFTSGSSGPPKGVIHSHGNALAAVQSGLAARCIDADTRLYLPMPFFWVGGFGSGVLSALLAGATLVTEEIPGTRRHCACWSGNASPCFAGGPTKPRRWHANPPLSEPICRRFAPAAWRRCYQPSNARNRVPGRSCSG